MAKQTTEKLASVRIDEGIAYICIDVQGREVNTLSTPMIDRFEEIVDGLQHETQLEGVVIHSGKEGNFIAGFDIEELDKYRKDPGGLTTTVERGHHLMERFSTLGVPVVAAIDGTCLGGGLELAMACAGRVATESPRTQLGLPEVQLGVIPGAGGTQRLPRLIDLTLALDMILTGKSLDAHRALKSGLVDDVVHPGILLRVAAEHARALAAEIRENGTTRNLENVPRNVGEAIADPVKLAARTPARRLVFNRAREQVMERTHGQYPAPLKALEVIETGFAHGFEAGIKAETEAFVDLVQTDVAHNLMGVFFMRNQVNKDAVVAKRVKPRKVNKIVVLGAGLMGAGITQVAAYNSFNVRLKDVDFDSLGRGLSYCRERFDELVERKKLTAAQADIRWGKISGATSYDGFKSAELVIEAVFEDLELKQKTLADIEACDNADQVYASNTSTIPISRIAEKARRPDNVLGMHFFSPVHRMPLLEIIRTEQTSDQALATALQVGRAMGKTCIVVNDGPGFFTSRVIGAYINEAGWILQEGASIEDIDQAMIEFGFPVGPMKLVDEVGIDVALKAGKVLEDAFPERWNAPSSLQAVAKDGRKGRKNKKGFYLYETGAGGPDETVYDLLPGGRERRGMDRELIQQRCWMAMLNECAYCLQENIARHPRDIDIGVIFGLGFPPFRGGILRHADSVGLRRVIDQLDQLADKFGERLRPADLLRKKAEKRLSFYED